MENICDMCKRKGTKSFNIMIYDFKEFKEVYKWLCEDCYEIKKEECIKNKKSISRSISPILS